MHSRALEQQIETFAKDAADALAQRLAATGEIPFELCSSGAGHRGRTSLYRYTPLVGRFVAENWSCLLLLPSYARALAAFAGFDGLDRYLAAHEVPAARRTSHLHTRASEALRVFVEDLFRDQSDFRLRRERLDAALARVALAASGEPGTLTIVATVHGLAIVSAEVQVAAGLRLARREALSGLPEQALWAKPFPAARSSQEPEHLIASLILSEEDGFDATVERGRELLRDLLRTLRLFGDGRIALGPLAWVSCEEGVHQPLALALPGRPRGTLVVREEDEDELRALWDLLARRSRSADPLTWALQRYEMGCERMSEEESITDHVLALQALLDPERRSEALLAARAAALCAQPGDRHAMAERLMQALALERALIDGGVRLDRTGLKRAHELSRSLANLLRDVVCGHLSSDLMGLADEELRVRQPGDEDSDECEGPFEGLREPGIGAGRSASAASEWAETALESESIRARDARVVRRANGL